MFRFFLGKGRKVLSRGRKNTAFSDESLSGDAGTRHVHVAIVGTGFSGLGMAIRLKQSGEGNFVVLEQSADIGGTWRDNTYPGCACDIPSHLYSFSFALNPAWSRTYSSQREIWDYLRNCAKRFGIYPHIQWNSALQDATWSEANQCWHLTTSQNQLTADILILGNGPLSEPALPSIPGIENFAGKIFHSARWEHDYDLRGKRVAIIGTGASAIQFVPHIQPQVDRLTLFQRTPPWILPRQDSAIPQWQRTLFRILPIAQHVLRARIYWIRELTALGFIYRRSMLKEGVQLAQHHLLKQVQDPVLRAKLTPHYEMGCKRVLLSNDFYPALTQPNVELVTEHIREVRTQSIVTQDNREYEIDTIICGTGFHVSDAKLPEHIYGRGGQSLAASWSTKGPNAYLGATVSNFPNLFLLIGPGTGLGHNSMVYMIQSQITYILDCLRVMRRRNLGIVEVRPEVQEAFYREMQQRMQGTVWTSGCSSWYLDAKGHNTTLWPGFTFEFRYRTRRFDVACYSLIPQQMPIHAAKAIGQAETS